MSHNMTQPPLVEAEVAEAGLVQSLPWYRDLELLLTLGLVVAAMIIYAVHRESFVARL